MKGRRIALSRARRIVSDHCHFARKTPLGVLRQTINIAPLVAARAAAAARPSWTSLFIKGFALVARYSPPLRQAYVKLPWPHLYEYPSSVASVVVERVIDGEDVIFIRRIKDPAARRSPISARRSRRRRLRRSRASAISAMRCGSAWRRC